MVTFLQAVKAAPEPCIGGVGCLDYANVEALIHPVVDIRVFELVFLFILFLWLGPQLHWAYDVAFLLLL